MEDLNNFNYPNCLWRGEKMKVEVDFNPKTEKVISYWDENKGEIVSEIISLTDEIIKGKVNWMLHLKWLVVTLLGIAGTLLGTKFL